MILPFWNIENVQELGTYKLFIDEQDKDLKYYDGRSIFTIESEEDLVNSQPIVPVVPDECDCSQMLGGVTGIVMETNTDTGNTRVGEGFEVKLLKFCNDELLVFAITQANEGPNYLMNAIPIGKYKVLLNGVETDIVHVITDEIVTIPTINVERSGPRYIF